MKFKMKSLSIPIKMSKKMYKKFLEADTRMQNKILKQLQADSYVEKIPTTLKAGEIKKLPPRKKKKYIQKLNRELIEKGLVAPDKKRSTRKKKLIFVFGSNLAGKHGKGSALKAKNKYGAVYGIGKGRTGNAYAIPTKDKYLKVLPLKRIQYYVSKFFHYAYKNPNLRFKVVKIGCGLAGYKEEEIIPMFKYFRLLGNVRLPEGWGGYEFKSVGIYGRKKKKVKK